LGVLGFGALAFGYRVTGSYLGFFLIVAATAAMAAGVGMFIAALGRTEQQSRSLAILVILGMLMLGGAWVPSFIMPKFIQSISFLTPVRWAVDGLDSMTFRGLPLSTALPSVGVLLLFAVVLILVAGKRFRWEPEGA
jgi:ABC-2 type transport system permease protein